MLSFGHAVYPGWGPSGPSILMNRMADGVLAFR
jgi:hypothetical protein